MVEACLGRRKVSNFDCLDGGSCRSPQNGRVLTFMLQKMKTIIAT